MDDHKETTNRDDLLFLALNGLEVLKETIGYETNIHDELQDKLERYLIKASHYKARWVFDNVFKLFEIFMGKLEELSGKLVYN